MTQTAKRTLALNYRLSSYRFFQPFPGDGYSETSSRWFINAVNLAFVQKNSVSTPGYFHLRATGQVLPTNNFSYVRYTNTGSRGSFTSRLFPNGTGWSYENHSYSPCIMGGHYEFAPSRSIYSVNSKLVEKMKAHQWNVPIFLAEAKKTSTMVVERATQLARMVNALRKGNFPQFVSLFHPSATPPGRGAEKRFNRAFGRDARKAASSTWLEYRYGWKPFMKDVQDAVNTVMDQVERPSSGVGRVRAQSSNSTITVERNSRVFVDTDVNIYIRGNVILELTESTRATWAFRPSAGATPGRFGLVNPLEVAWELIPLSFVADWFAPIGSYIRSLDVPYTTEHVGGSYGTRCASVRKIVATKCERIGASWSGFDGTSTWLEVKRLKMLNLPTLELADMPFRFDLGSAQVASAIALLHQALSRLGR